MASKNQYTWAAYEKDWEAVGNPYQPPSYPDGTLFQPEDDMHPLRLNGVIGKGPDCDYLILGNKEWHQLRKKKLLHNE
jgi:hypothetical protein